MRKLKTLNIFKSKIYLLFIILILSFPIYADNIKISGVVNDSQGSPLIGVSIVDKKINKGTVTDIDGKFLLNVDENTELTISYIGFETQIVKAKSTMSITLLEKSTQIEDVVIVGYGTQTKVNLTGSVSNIDQKKIESRPITNVSSGIAGLLPGVTSVQRSGRPGGDGASIKIRGVGTLNNSDPLVLIDGIEGDLNSLNPNDIASITTLKDAASSAIYGSKASNGVLLVTTKRGKDKTQITYNLNFGFQSPTRLPQYMSSGEYAKLLNEAYVNDKEKPLYTDDELKKFKDQSDPYNYPNTDWQGLLYKGSGIQSSHNFTASGGSDNVKYLISLGYIGQDGIIKNSSKNQYNIRSNIDAKLNPKLSATLDFSLSRIDTKDPTNSYMTAAGGSDAIFNLVNRISPIVPYKRKNGDYGSVADGNPIAWLDINQYAGEKKDYLIFSTSLRRELCEGLYLKGVLSYSSSSTDNNEFRKFIQYSPESQSAPNRLTQSHNLQKKITSDILLNYDKSFKENNLSLLFGFNSQYLGLKYTSAYRENFPSNEFIDIDGGSAATSITRGYSRELALLSLFGRLKYDYKNRYFIETNFRYDGTSRFAKGNRWGLFPSFSAAWRISEESFMSEIKKQLSNIKIRYSWGILGNQNALNDVYYPTVSTIQVTNAGYPFDGSFLPGAVFRRASNHDLKWEKSLNWGIGLDMSFNNSFNISLDYYNKLTKGVIMNVDTPETYGLASYIANLGEVLNNGFEAEFSHSVQIGLVSISYGGNFSYNRNKINRLAGDINQPFNDPVWRLTGYPVNSIYGLKTRGLYQSEDQIKNGPDISAVKGNSAQPGDIVYVDLNGDGKVDLQDRTYLGSTDPKYTFGFNFGFEYKNFDMSLFFQGVGGVLGYLGPSAYGTFEGDVGKPTIYWRDRWNKTSNPRGTAPRLGKDLSQGPSSPSIYSDFWIKDAKYLRLKNLQFGYTFPESFLKNTGITKLRVYYSGQNLLTFTPFIQGYDPETPVGRGSAYPQTLIHSVGLSINF